MYRSDPWASDLLKRYDKEGIEGQNDRTKVYSIPPALLGEARYQIRKN